MRIFRRKLAEPLPVPPEPVIGTSGSLREFVYLDEVSVYSLTSSPDMPPPASMSEVAGHTSGAAVNARLEGGAPVVAKAAVGSELTSGRSRELRVERQFNIQSQFARLHGMYRPTFLLAATEEEVAAESASSLQEALEELERSRRARRASDLKRGGLAELRVSLSAHHTFDIASFMRLATGLIKKYPEFLNVNDAHQLQAAMDGGEFLAELMEDLVPIEGRAVAYGIVDTAEGERWVADVDALRKCWKGPLDVEPLRVVGVAEAAAFWKDTRRILHAEAEFDILGRVSRSGLQDEWTPVKMVETFRRVVPSAAAGFLKAVDDLKDLAKTDPSSAESRGSALALAGQLFALSLAKHHGVEPQAQNLALLGGMEEAQTLEANLVALSRVAVDFYAHHSELTRDEDLVGELRQRSWQSARFALSEAASLSVGGGADGEAEVGVRPPGMPDTKPPVLELEFIAMYW